MTICTGILQNVKIITIIYIRHMGFKIVDLGCVVVIHDKIIVHSVDSVLVQFRFVDLGIIVDHHDNK